MIRSPRASLLCHDGDGPLLGVLPCGPLYSAERIVEVREHRMSAWDAEGPDQQDPPWWGAHRVPFAGGQGGDGFVDRPVLRRVGTLDR
ncbi:hypothetical protein [Kitasatospora purpeofusca]|uniref:hypothetical protein n=1 Tax=Kitasatospora purpeofusca TaxID=67352 RepID=UPI0036D3BDE0